MNNLRIMHPSRRIRKFLFQRLFSSHVGIAEKYMCQVNQDMIKYDENQYKIVKVWDISSAILRL